MGSLVIVCSQTLCDLILFWNEKNHSILRMVSNVYDTKAIALFLGHIKTKPPAGRKAGAVLESEQKALFGKKPLVFFCGGLPVWGCIILAESA